MKQKHGQIFYEVQPSTQDLHVGRESHGFPTRWLVAAVVLILAAFFLR
jgi:hypothetical protein